METNRLKQFCTIVETGNLRKAADLMGISHSGLSKSMKVFEAELGHPLFQQSGRGIVVSDEGQLLYRRSGTFFKELDHLLGREEAKSTTVKLGSFEVFTTYFLGKFLSEDFSNTSIEVYELVPGQLEEALMAGRVDYGVSYEPIPRPGIVYEKIGELSMGAFARSGAFSKNQLEDIPFAVPNTPLEGSPTGSKGLDAWPYDKLVRREVYRVDMMESALELAREGLAAVFIPVFIADLHNEKVNRKFQLEKRPLPKKAGVIKRNIYLIRRESSEVDNLFIRKLAKAVRQYCY